MRTEDIQLYVTDSDQIRCGMDDCPTDCLFDLPHPRRRTLAELIDMIVTHANKHHVSVMQLMSTDFPGKPRGRSDTITIIPDDRASQ